jgi:hypothetical protein
MKFFDPAFVQRFRHAGAGFNQDDFFLAENSGWKQKYPPKKNSNEPVRSVAHTILSVLRKFWLGPRAATKPVLQGIPEE